MSDAEPATTPGQKLLARMLERLYASTQSGPAMRCRPHSSRQRVDLAELAKLDDADPAILLRELLSPDATSKRVAAKREPSAAAPAREREAFDRQQALLKKLRTIAEDAATFEQEHGVHALYVGFPLLSVGRRKNAGQRVLAPIAFIPVRLALKRGRAASVELTCAAEGADRVIPNPSLLAWVEQESGARLEELFADDEGREPWRELDEIVTTIFRSLELEVPEPPRETDPLRPVPRAEEEDPSGAPTLIPSAVLGLYPMSNQALVQDTQGLIDQREPPEGPIRAFLDVGARLVDDDGEHVPAEPRLGGRRVFSEERLVTHADPCQARAVRLARTARGLVVHGPPGTGKSQTITNIIGDHLARGERVLFVCDKRTALDVVSYRLGHLGLGDLCAVVHDAQRDQRDLYMGIRQQLDALNEEKLDPRAVKELAAIDRELDEIHEALTQHHRRLADRPDEGTGASFHELVGEWLAVDAPAELVAAAGELGEVSAETTRAAERPVSEALTRAASVGYHDNPWRDALGLSLADYLRAPIEAWRRRVEEVVSLAEALDATADAAIPRFDEGDVVEQGRARRALSTRLAAALEGLDAPTVKHWVEASPAARKKAERELAALAPSVALLDAAAPDPELAVLERAAAFEVPRVAEWIAVLGSYLAIASAWYAFLFFFTRRRRARVVLERLGLPIGADSAGRAHAFLGAVRAKRMLRAWHEDAIGEPPDDDDALSRRAEGSAALCAILRELDEDPRFAGIAGSVREGLVADANAVVTALAASETRAEAIADLESALEQRELFAASWIRALGAEVRRGVEVAPTFVAMRARFDTVEGLLRMRTALDELPGDVARAVIALAERGADVEGGGAAIRRAMLASQIRARLSAADDRSPSPRERSGEALRSAQPSLLQPLPKGVSRESEGSSSSLASSLGALDGGRLDAFHRRHRELERQKQGIVGSVVRHVWASRQRERLLAATGSRLNADGAAVRRRLMLRGERAMKVRQAIAAGASTEGGDPLFDLRPVWMASPSTVAQIFPRAPIFDVVIFDEASQCRLEEALPVLLRAKRVVIAGDPKQLPPTRFFESAVSQSQAEELEDDQALFEDQQAEIDDLLGAALNIEIEQAYLDVHYRSRNADLIGFSNESFYDARLQAIPGHPRNRAKHAPLRLLQVNGTYAERANPREAEEVVKIVRALLDDERPPSIGIVSFNLTQRDLIVEALEAAASEDRDFGRRLEEARRRRGADSFEGLFVRNLESVQGDERDHIIVSTTYGPDARGRFYRRFGPLGRAGGGRRLNVLVTRARCEIHLVTSIPPEIYRGAPPAAPGQRPNGAWYLFSYLAYAERLEERYRAEAARLAEAEVAEAGCFVGATTLGSRFSETLAARLAKHHGVPTDVYWGNDGFCVDVALHHPSRAEDVTIGVLCDGTRFDKTDDPVEWDLFRARVLEANGWDLARVWTPDFFRDPRAGERAILAAAERHLEREAREPAVPLDAEPRTLH